MGAGSLHVAEGDTGGRRPTRNQNTPHRTFLPATFEISHREMRLYTLRTCT
jgi:hypothetical protein